MEFILDTDASDTGIGTVLSQVHNGQEKVIGYASRTLNTSERNYSKTKRQMLALVNGRYCIAVADERTGQVVRWLEKLGEFDFKNQSRLGRRHGNAEGLFRRPQETDSELPVVGTVTTESFSN